MPDSSPAPTVAHTAASYVRDFANWWLPYGVLVLSGGVAVTIGKDLANAVFHLGV